MGKLTAYELRDQVLALDPDARANLLALIEREEVRVPFQPQRADIELWDALVRNSTSVMFRSLDGFLRDKTLGVSRLAWRGAISYLAEFAAAVAPVRRSDEDRAALVDLGIKCLAGFLRRRGDTVTPKALLMALPHLRAAIDQDFPGYWESGLLAVLIARVKQAEPVAAE